MELQNKFEEIIKHSIIPPIKDNNKLAKECTKLCLEEQVKLLEKYTTLKHSDFLNSQNHSLTLGEILGMMAKEKKELEEKLKELENERK